MEENKYLHVIAFNVPYPPNYGGIIDIYYKLKALHEKGIKIILHAYHYGRNESAALSALTYEIYYYKRKTRFRYLLHKLPYIVVSRQSEQLEKKLLSDGHPVFFEGLHTTFLLEKCKQAGKKTFVRSHNIEHNYYKMLGKSNRNIFKKFYFQSEAKKLKVYENILSKADQIIAISSSDAAYFKEKYGNVLYVSAFHQNEDITALAGSGEYILFHGNLSVPENENALLYLIANVFSRISHHIIIAGKDPGNHIRKKCAANPKIKLIANPPDEEMSHLLANAHINLLYTEQPTGLKLKLLHSLYEGRYCMVNPLMLYGSGLDDLCVLYSSPEEAIEKINELMRIPFSSEEINLRKKALKEYDNSFNADKLISVLQT